MERYRPISSEGPTPSFPNNVQLLVEKIREMYNGPEGLYSLASLVNHDLNGAASKLIVACDMAEGLDSRFKPSLKTLETIRKIENLTGCPQTHFINEVKSNNGSHDESIPLDQCEIEPEIKKIIKRYLDGSRLIEAIVQSATFFDYVGRGTDSLSAWQSLKELEVEFSDIVNFLNLGELQLTNSLKLKGPEAIIAFNLLKNAKRHGQAIKVTTGKEDTCFSIQNESPHPLPEAVIKDPSRPYQKNSNDRFHYGLMITSFYAQAMGGQIIAESERLEGAENYLISFTYYRPPHPVKVLT